MAELTKKTILSLRENPPDLLAAVGAYGSLSLGGACVGVVTQAVDASLSRWTYIVYGVNADLNADIQERVSAIAPLLSFPKTSDGTAMKLKAAYDRIRSVDAVEIGVGMASLVHNEDTLMQPMLRHKLKGSSSLDLQNLACVQVLKEDSQLVMGWAECLYSIIKQNQGDRANNPNSQLQVLTSRFWKTDDLIDELRSLEITSNGQIKNASALLMAFIYSVGRIEYMVQTRTLPFQKFVDSRKQGIQDG